MCVWASHWVSLDICTRMLGVYFTLRLQPGNARWKNEAEKSPEFCHFTVMDSPETDVLSVEEIKTDVLVEGLHPWSYSPSSNSKQYRSFSQQKELLMVSRCKVIIEDHCFGSSCFPMLLTVISIFWRKCYQTKCSFPHHNRTVFWLVRLLSVNPAASCWKN